MILTTKKARQMAVKNFQNVAPSAPDSCSDRPSFWQATEVKRLAVSDYIKSFYFDAPMFDWSNKAVHIFNWKEPLNKIYSTEWNVRI